MIIQIILDCTKILYTYIYRYIERCCDWQDQVTSNLDARIYRENQTLTRDSPIRHHTRAGQGRAGQRQAAGRQAAIRVTILLCYLLTGERISREM